MRDAFYSRISRIVKLLFNIGLLFLLLFSAFVKAESSPLAPSLDGVDGTHLQYHCRAPEGALTPRDMLSISQQLNWKPVQHIPVNLGFTNQDCWFQSRLTNVSSISGSYIMSAGYSLLERVDLLITDEAARVVSFQQAGTNIQFSEWPIQNHTPAFEIEIPSGESRTLIWRLRSAYSIQFDARLYLSESFSLGQEKLLLVHSLFFGAMLVMILYNLLLYSSIRDKVYVLYVFWGFSMTGFQFIYLGFAQRFFWGENPHLATASMAMLLPFAIIFGPWFTRIFLDLKTVSPFEDNLLKGISACGVLLLFSHPFLDIYWIVPLCTLTILIMALTILGICLHRLRFRDRSAIYFTVAWACLIIGITIMALNKLGVVPLTDSTDYLVELGTFLEVTLLSLALAERINTLKAESQHSKAERLQAEFEAAKALELSKSKSEFLAAMSHEIRTPMNGVLGMADLLRRAKLPAESLSYAETIFQSTQSLLTVINDILDYSRIESGKLEIENIETDVEQLVDECVMLFATQSRSKEVPLITSIDSSLPESVLSDPVRLKQIINNLLSNAFKFTDNGSVRLSLLPSKSNDSKKPFFVIEVADSGIGLSSEEQSKLFNAFSQADRTITRRFGGSGLGLTICKNLAELMDGTIRLSSKKGEGTTFQVALPLVPVREQADGPLTGRNVLLMEPDDQQASAYGNLMARWGMNVRRISCTDEDQAEAIEQAEVIVVNNTCFDRFPAFENWQKVPALIQIGDHRKDYSGDQAFAGAFAHMPVNYGELKQILITALGVAQPEAKKDDPSLPIENWSTLSVLVAEDNPVNQMVISRMLGALGIKANIVADGKQALDYCAEAKKPIDIVFMDCDMPVMDGYEAAQAIRRDYDCRVSRIVGLSANAASEQITRALCSGMDDYVTKPVTMKALTFAIKNAVAAIEEKQSDSQRYQSGA